jgi:predicted ATPase/DNA-binding SARP family transcriptional activator
MLQLRLLGALELTVDGTVVPVPGARLRSLLAVLAVRAPEVVSVDALQAALWGDEPPSTNALQKLVSKLRRVLPVDDLVTESVGYRLAVDDDALDIKVFERLVAAGRHREALALWRGDPLADFTYEEWAQTEITRLQELHLVAIEAHVDEELREARHAELVGELEALVREYPLRERLRAQLMRALYAGGRQADALRAYQDARAVLAEQLGLEPGPELRELEALVLNQDGSLAPPRPVLVRRRSNLRAPLTPLVGRATESDAVTALIARSRIVTLVGPGGAGKTRLAVEVARRIERDYADGAWIIELASVTDPASLPLAVADALAIADLPNAAASADPIDRLVSYLEPKAMLLVLDNCEHLVTAAASLSAELAQRCAQLRIVATSREGLGVPGESLFPVPALPIDDAVELFVRCATSIAPDLAFDDAARAQAIDICTRLDGLPLAIELAAARVRALPLGEVATRLDRRFRLLTGGARTAVPRQQTLRAVVDWSYELLFEQERAVFEYLSVFVGGCTLAASEQVCASEDLLVEDVADLLGRLVDKSLVIADRSGASVRYRMLQTLNEYAREKLATRPEATAVRERHAAYYDTIIADSEAAYFGDHQNEWLATVRVEIDNIRAAFEWAVEGGDAGSAQQLAARVAWFWWSQGRTVEGLRWLERALALDGPVEPAVRARALTWSAWLALGSGQMPPDDTFAAARAAFADADDVLGLALALFAFGEIKLQAGHLDEALAYFDESAQLHTTPDVPSPATGIGLFASGRGAMARGNLDLAAQEFRTAAELATRYGNDFGAVLALSNLAEVTETLGTLEECRQAIEQALALGAAAGLISTNVWFTARLANVEMLLGNLDTAEMLHDEALGLSRDLFYPAVRAFTLNTAAVRLRRQQRLDEAERAATEALAMFRVANVEPGSTQALVTLGFIAETRGDHQRASALHHEGLTQARDAGNLFTSALAIEGLASAAAASGDHRRAAALLGTAAALRARVGSQLAGTGRVDVDRTADAARTVLGAPAFDDEFAGGMTADLDALTS